MKINLTDLKKEDKKNVYTFHSAKKIFFARTPSKTMLLEKKDNKTKIKAVSLISRNPIVFNKDSGMLLYPKSK